MDAANESNGVPCDIFESFGTKPWGILLEAFLTAFSYGMIVVLFLVTSILLFKSHKNHPKFNLLIFILFMSFVLNTSQIALVVLSAFQRTSIQNSCALNGTTLVPSLTWISIFSEVLLTTQIFMSDTFLLYRTWVLWNRKFNLKVILFPLVLDILVFVVATVGWLPQIWHIPVPNVPIVVALSLVSTVWCTVAITNRLIHVHAPRIKTNHSLAKLAVAYSLQSGLLYTLALLTCIFSSFTVSAIDLIPIALVCLLQYILLLVIFMLMIPKAKLHYCIIHISSICRAHSCQIP
ncbi:hypothetical protein SISNIDRAFT_318028 [Sistotremastrum niveocremeum HHB9708]|uniref:Uncharacterized protein n=1 Tax=Sistotremastrum niveocremeum HHB9708 TaxID=1314777 RepID=A0A164Y4A0_9AGAM|nr:hypothetical protein SISNIDRAFT_318028 [Sistotremastrum niveocremeum HHB9708]